MQPDVEFYQVVVLSNASSANAARLKGQLGFFIFIVNSLERDNIFHLWFSRYNCVTNYVMTANDYALVHSFDHQYHIRKMLCILMGRHDMIETSEDSRPFFIILGRTAAQ